MPLPRMDLWNVHSTIGLALWCMLHGTSLDYKYWPFAFTHFLCINAIMPKVGSVESSYMRATGKPSDANKLHSFGSYMWAWELGHHSFRLNNHSYLAKFLGYCNTMKFFVCLNVQTDCIHYSTHAQFDEGQFSDPMNLTPNAKQLWAAAGRILPLRPLKSLLQSNSISFLLTLHFFSS